MLCLVILGMAVGKGFGGVEEDRIKEMGELWNLFSNVGESSI